MANIDFPTAFKALTGNPPFPWQEALFARLISGDIPSSAHLPTGLGKTSIVAIWLIALAHHRDRVPRRLVYVVNRRTVVDQTTTEVMKLQSALLMPELYEVRNALASLCALPLPTPDAPPLAISTMRGQFADNGEWCADPSRPAVVVGTVDMIGSGLLFSRYTRGFKTRPLQAGFLAQDALLIHDEAHLEPSFQKLLASITAAQHASGDIHTLRVLELTATSRTEDTNNEPPFTLTDADRENDIVKKRINAVKRLSISALDEGEKLDAKLVSLAKAKSGERAVLVFTRSVETAVKIAAELDKGDHKRKVATLTGTMRGKERDELVSKNPVFQRFLPETDRTKNIEPATGTVFLVATSAGEVGVNLSADDLVCDLSTYESMAQRFGRVNRFGELDDSSIIVVYSQDLQSKYDEGLANVRKAPKDAAKKAKAYETKNKNTLSRLKTLKLLRLLATLKNGVGDASPAALDALIAADRAAAFSPPPEMRVATAVQFDAWALTTIREPLAARPPVAPYLHGETDWEPPETHVAWRDEVQLLTGSILLESYPPEELLEDFPLKPHELLRDTTERVFDRLLQITENLQRNRRKIPDAWLVLEEGKVEVFSLKDLLTDEASEEGDTDENEADDEEDSENNSAAKSINDAAKRRKARFVSLLADRTLILPPSFGGLSGQGFLSIAADAESTFDVSTVATMADHKPERIRLWSDTPKIPTGSEYATSYRLVRAIDTQLSDEDLTRDDGDTGENATHTDDATTNCSRYWLWLAEKTTVGVERRFSANKLQPETLAIHTAAVEGHARSLAQKLLPEPVVGHPNLHRSLVLAAALHDFGKDREQWQRNLGNRDNLGDIDYDPAKPETILAKSAPGMRPRNLAEHYRHEFGSLSDAAREPEAISLLATLSVLERDIVLHLVAAHHGRARPHFPEEEIFDYAAISVGESLVLATEVPRRFARLQKHFGRWGLAWLESLLRAADYAASAGIEPLEVGNSSPLDSGQSIGGVQTANAYTFAADISLRLNPANPGHYFACCGLFEFAAALAPDAHAWFTEDDSTFHISDTNFSLKELLEKITASKISALDSEDRPLTPLEVSFTGGGAKPHILRIDWWRHEGGLIGKLKPWAGQMSVRDIANDMRGALEQELGHHAPPALENILFYSSTANDGEPFYFDANRAINAKAQDVGFSVDKLKKGSVKIASTATPSVELLCLIGLQRARPLLAVNERGKEREYDYHLWHSPLPLPPLAAAVAGLLPGSASCFRFSNPSRAKDYRAFTPANRIC